MAAALGLRGMPGVCEALGVERGVLLSELTGSAFHVAHMSARASLRAVRKGKEAGVRVTCEVAPHHFTLTDESLVSPIPYDTNVKMNPPLREAADRDAMLSGIADGSVDAIATDHAPHHYDEKNVEFDRAPFGIVGLETAVSLSLARLVHAGRHPAPAPGRTAVGESGPHPRCGRRIALARHAGRHHDTGAGSPGADRGEAAALALKKYAVRRLAAAGWRGGHIGRRPAGVRQRRRRPRRMNRRDEVREKALKDLQQYEVLMLNGHFDFGNGYHGAAYLNPHQLFRYPSTIWRFAQDLLDVLPRVRCRGHRGGDRPCHRWRLARAYDGGTPRQPEGDPPVPPRYLRLLRSTPTMGTRSRASMSGR